MWFGGGPRGKGVSTTETTSPRGLSCCSETGPRGSEEGRTEKGAPARKPPRRAAYPVAYLLVHHAISAWTAKASAAADLDPDRVSFAQALRLIRRTATGTAAIPPSGVD